RTYAVRAPLSDFIAFLWYYESGPSPSPKELVLPAGRADIIIGLRHGEIEIPTAGEAPSQTFPGGVVSGPHSRSFAINSSRPSAVIGVNFRPGGAPAVLGLPAGELRDLQAPLDSVWRDAPDIRERLL